MIALTDTDLARWLGEFFWPFVRTLALLSAAPGFNSPLIPVRAKVALAFLIAVVLATVIKHAAPLDLSMTTLVLVIEQVLVGVAIGFAMQLTLAAMAMAGEFIGVQMGFGIAALFDVQTGFAVPVISNFFGLTGLLLFFALNGHLLLLGVLLKSFEIVPIASGSGIGTEGWRTLARAGASLFQMGVWLALPVIAVLLAAHVAVAVVSRVAPQFNLMSIGFSIFIWVGLAALVALLPFFVPAVQHMIEAGLNISSAAMRGVSP